MPVCCVDVVIYYKGKVLLVKRRNEPEKNEWWLPGGRIYKNEKLEDAALRKALEETGVKTRIIKKLGVYEYFSDKSAFSGASTHSVIVGFLLEPLEENISLKIDRTSSDFKWVDEKEKKLAAYVKTLIKDSGVFN
jgi:colanic acid biosynthesis protein WcaH